MQKRSDQNIIIQYHTKNWLLRFLLNPKVEI